MKKKPTKNMSHPHPPPLFVTLIALLLISITATSASNGTVLIVRGNATITSVNKTFELGFFNTNGDSNYYLGIWYTSVTPQTYVWVANRNTPTKNLDTSSFELNRLGRLAVKASENVTVWQSSNLEASSLFQFRDDANLVLLSPDLTVAWQSFDHPTDTWLPGMNLTRDKVLTCWKTVSDPSPGFYSLRLNPHDYGEFELVYNSTEEYWTTGNWTGQSFSNVPEMNAPYIYRFNFVDPFIPTASFGFKVTPLDPTSSVPLSMFRLEYDGRLHQYTWSNPNENWYQFWVQPVDVCHVYGLCGSFGFCGGGGGGGNGLRTCECVGGFKPRNDAAWESKDYSGGCVRENLSCGGNDESFRGIGTVRFDGAVEKSFVVDKGGCERECLKNCECIGLYYNERSRLCTNLYGSLLNLQKLNYSVGGENMLYVRVDSVKKVRKSLNLVGLIGSIVGSVLFLGFVGVMGFVLVKRKWNGVIEEDREFGVLNMRVFSYKELHIATRGFSEKLGHGGFGTVFQGELKDSSLVAVKRLDRPGGAEREFRAEVCTIGNIQHVNLVRLRGFCSEKSHRLLVYDYMPNGCLSVYLRQEGPHNLSWDVRFRAAVGTARGLAYLHEECRDCIIHCDIKPENILLDNEFNAKVSDFGLAKLIGRDFSRVLATMRGTWGYVAPEWISGVEITTKADVYSYGMTLLELIGGRRNVQPSSSGKEGGGGDGGGAGEKWFFPPWAAQKIIEGNIGAVVDSRLGGAYVFEEVKRVALVAVWCIQDNEVMRPTMGMVVKMLEGLVEVTVPPAPKLLQALVSGESFCGVRAESGNGVSSCSGFYGVDGVAAMSSGGSESSLGNVSSPVNKNVNA